MNAASAKPLRYLIGFYFWLLIFEGALRFWALPSLSGPLMLARDPVVCLIYLLALGSGQMPRNGFIAATLALAAVTAVTSFLFTNTPFWVTIYGLRANFLHLPMIFVMQRVLTAEDVQRLGRWMMWLMVPMALLVVHQFRSPIGSFINQGGMPTHYGTVRPSGTFPFVSGMVCFSALVAAYLGHQYVNAPRTAWFLKMGCSAAMLAALAVSGSRSSILAVGIVIAMLLGLSLFQSKAQQGAFILLGVTGLAAASLSSTEFFEEGQRQLAQRFKDASGHQGILASSWERWVGMFQHPIWQAQQSPWFGHGQGTGTNVGFFLVTGKRGFGGGQETEMGRVIYEMGAVLGGCFLLLRFGIVVRMLVQGWRVLHRGNVLPMLLLGASGMNVTMGTWGITNMQGFATFGAGLCLAAVKVGQPSTIPTRRRRPQTVLPRGDAWRDARIVAGSATASQ